MNNSSQHKITGGAAILWTFSAKSAKSKFENSTTF